MIIGISANHNRYKDPYLSAAKKYLDDHQKKKSLLTVPIYRGIDDKIDNSKFLYPIKGIPVLAFTIRNALKQHPEELRVTGKDEAGNLVELMNGVYKSRIKFYPEGDRSSLCHSIESLFCSADAEQYCFVSGDIPFAKNYAKSFFTDVVFDFNKQSLTSGTSVKRNFYNYAVHKGIQEYFKEPNIYFFSPKGYSLLKEAGDTFYSQRKGGGLCEAAIDFLRNSYEKDGLIRRGIQKNLLLGGIEITKLMMQRAGIPSPSLNFNRLNKVAGDILGMTVQLSFEHDDIFRMLDLDGLNNDWVLYEGLMRKQKERIPKKLLQIAEEVKNNPHLFPLNANFEDVIRDYINKINVHLPNNRIDFSGLEEFFQMNVDESSVNDLNKLLSKTEL